MLSPESISRWLIGFATRSQLSQWRPRPRPLPPGRPSREEIPRHAPVVRRAEHPVRERYVRERPRAASPGAEVPPDLVRQIPPAVERVTQHEERGKPETQEPEYHEYRHRTGF